MVSALTIFFSVVIAFQLVAVYAAGRITARHTGVREQTANRLLSAIVFITVATSARLGFYTGILERGDLALLESYFYGLGFLAMILVSLGWHKLRKEPESEQISRTVRKFYGGRG